jgi:hypothetical protein
LAIEELRINDVPLDLARLLLSDPRPPVDNVDESNYDDDDDDDDEDDRAIATPS